MNTCRSQRGQVLVLGSLLMAAVAVMLFRYYQTGQVVADRVKQTHALDAATYSGALASARVLNSLAFINRAHVAHQVAMAHLVTLGSWSMLAGNKARQLGQANPPAHLIGMLFGAQHGTAYLMARKAAGFTALAQTGGELAVAFARHDYTLRNQLVMAQNDLVASADSERDHVIRHVLHRNFPDTPPDQFLLQVSAVPLPSHLLLQSGQGSLRSTVEQARQFYQFLDERNNTARNTWAVDPRCPWLRHQLRRRGSTTLQDDGRWQSVDTESFHALRSNRWVGCYFREYPMGWGWIPGARTQAFDGAHVADPPESFSAKDFWRWVRDSTDWNIASGEDNPLANSRAVAGRASWYGGGLPALFELIKTPDRPVFSLMTRLSHASAEGMAVSTESAAETFFERPVRRGDGKQEHANLFRPYWQARLARSSPVQFWKGRQP